MLKPTVDEIHEYMTTKGMDDFEEAESFIDHYTMVGWVVTKAKTPMKCWRSAVRIWLRNNRKWSKTHETSQRSNQTHSQRQHQQAADAYKQMELEHTESDSGIIRQIQ